MKTAKYLLFLATIVAGTFQPIYSQMNEKKTLTEKDYDRWHQLFTNNCSKQGNWISYTHHYESNKDTLFIKNTKSFRVYAFAKGFNPTFIGESKVAVQKSENALLIVDLEKGSTQHLENVVEYAVAKSNLYIIIKQLQEDKANLIITDTNGNTLQEIPNVAHWKMNSTNEKVACYKAEGQIHTVQIVDLKKKLKTTTIVKSDRPIMQLEWNKAGTIVAFLSPKEGQVDKGVLFCYHTEMQELKYIKLTNQNVLPSHSVNETYSTQLRISDDGQRVFFGVEETLVRTVPDPSSVQVWNTADKSIYPGKIEMNDWRRRPIISVWWPQIGKITQITDNNLPFMQLDAKMKYAITYNPLQYDPQFKYHGDRDYYITNLQTGKRTLFLKQASGEPSDLIASPDSKFLLYYSALNWWSYNLVTEKHINITKQIQWKQKENYYGNNAHDALTNRIAGFTSDDKDVFINDAYDIWKVSTNGTSFRKLTNGQENLIRFRIIPIAQAKPQEFIFDGYQAPQYDDKKFIYVKGINTATQENGIYRYNQDKGIKAIVIKNKMLNEIILIKNQKKAYYIEQDFALPPQIIGLDLRSKSEKLIHQSNKQHAQYFYGRSELFSFEVLGETVGGVLLFPANYNPKLKYPTIVHIYEKQTSDLHLYQNPSISDSAGFNRTNFTAQGYIVCLPNMLFEIGNTGEVASKCVNAAVQNIIDRNIADKDRIGLIGHSYGGYETNFIATQQNPFKTAVAGASYSDLAADFVHVAWDFKTPDYRRYESGQMRMGSTLFENQMRFHKNSPLLLAEGVSIPLLLWSGEEDKHVDVNHSYKFHMALRRLKKQNIMLIYPSEKHTIENQKNQIDLNRKINEWFDYFLKEAEYKAWMMPDYIGN